MPKTFFGGSIWKSRVSCLDIAGISLMVRKLVCNITGVYYICIATHLL